MLQDLPVRNRVRSWRRSDLEPLRTIAWETWKQTYGGFIPEEDMRDFHNAYYTPASLQRMYNAINIHGWIALAGREMVGYSMSHWNPDSHVFYITSLYVLPDYQKQGFGKAMLDRGMDLARNLGTDRLNLGVMAENEAALEWYHRQGFVFEERKPFAVGKTTVDDLLGYKLI